MSGLLLPKGTYIARQREKAAAAAAAAAASSVSPDAGTNHPFAPVQSMGKDCSGIELYDLSTPIPSYVPTPARFLIALMPVSVKDKIGNVWLPDTAIEQQMWINGIGKVCALGPGVFKGRRFEDMGLTPEDAPKVGDLVIYNAKTPNRFKVDGVTLILVADDGYHMTVDPEHAHRITF